MISRVGLECVIEYIVGNTLTHPDAFDLIELPMNVFI
jgi:hypothetical protein